MSTRGLSSTVEAWLRDVLHGHTTEDKILEVLAGWREYFYRLRIAEADQQRDFDATMRMRAANGCISVLADDIDRALAR